METMETVQDPSLVKLQSKIRDFQEQHVSAPLADTPGYIVAANNHAMMNGDASSLSAPAGEEDPNTPFIHGIMGAGAGALAGVQIGAAVGAGLPGAILGGIVGAATGYDWRFTAASLVSGTSQLLDGVNAIAHIASPEETAPTDRVTLMQSFDNNLADYYQAHQESVDATGFIAGSLIPGIAGVKVYNAAAGALKMAATGSLGINFAEGTGLLAGTHAMELAAAKEAFITSGETFSLLNANVVKALAAGAGEQALQAGAFELGVQAGMSNSPILANEDWKDIASNTLNSALFGGALGGVVGAVADIAGIKKALSLTDLRGRAAEFQQGTKAGTSIDANYLANAESIDEIHAANILPTEGFDDVVARKASAATNKIDDNNRSIMQSIAGGDREVANMLHQFVGATSPDMLSKSRLVLGLEELGRPSTILPQEKELLAAEKKFTNGAELSQEEQDILSGTSVKFINIWGDRAGLVETSSGDALSNLWNSLAKGSSIKLEGNNVIAGKDIYKVSTLKPYDIGQETKVAAANARDLWALKTDKILSSKDVIHENDPSLLRKAIRDVGSSNPLTILHIDGSKSVITTAKEASDLLESSLARLRVQMRARSITESPDSKFFLSDRKVASMLGVKPGWLDGSEVNVANPASDIHALAAYENEYKAMLGDKVKIDPNTANILFHPQQVKAVYNVSKIDAANYSSLPFNTYLKQQQVILGQAADRAVASILGEYYEQFPNSSDIDIRRTTREKVGSSSTAAANADYGSQGHIFERIGHIVNKIATEWSNNITSRFDPVAFKIVGDDIESQKAAMELSIIANKIRSFPDRYVIDEEGSRLVHQDVARYEKELAKGVENISPPEKISTEAEDYIPIADKRVLDILVLNRELNKERLKGFNAIRSISGAGDTRNPEHVYFPPPDLKSYKHFALVTDPSITGTGHSKMIYAATEEQLQKLIALVPDEFKAGVIKSPVVKTKEDLERWYKSIDAYKKDETMSENYMDAALYKSGAASRYILQTDAKTIINGLKDWHLNSSKLLLRETVSLKYFKEFQELRNLGDREASIRLSSFTTKSAAKYAKENSDNPYMSYIRTALDIPNSESIPLRATQDWADRQVSKIWDTFTEAFAKTKTVADLDMINKMVTDAGIKTINYDALNIALANHTIPQGALSTFTRRANAILASVILKPSVLNTVNNIVGMNVLLAPEMSAVLSAIKSGSAEGVGALSELAHIRVPGSTKTEAEFLSAPKLIANAIKDFHSSTEIREWLKSRGFSVRHSQEINDIIDTMALSGSHTAHDLNSRIELAYSKAIRLGNKIEGYTGNSYAEEVTRGVSALIMKQMTDIAVREGKMTGQVADAYIQTFVNRVNGNYLASQRPMMFNGPVGQAVGLFQTYMVTLLQQSLRHVAQGNTKSLALMLAAQSTIYGAAALPGFRQLNTALVGNAAGNTDHKDLFSIAYGAMDKNAADWAMYGALGNVLGLLSPDLKLNMYTRGDVNPRNVSIIPLDPRDYPIATAGAKFFGNLYDTFDQLVIQGAPMGTTILRALEHNGLSRELSGLAQVMNGFINPQMRAYSTTSGGSLVGSNDLMSFMTLARLSGAKPLDEAIAQDASFRQVAFEAKKHDDISRLGESIKAQMVGNQVPGMDVLVPLQERYIKLGGKQEGFNQYMMSLYKDANVSLANREAKDYTDKLRKKLASPSSRYMQLLMGGKPSEGDFYSQ